MLKVQSSEWKEFIDKLEVIKTKSNREVLCIHCWQMLNCKQKIKHLKKNPDHEKYLLTSTKYASEKQILSLSKTQNKYYTQNDGEYVLTPYGPLNRQFRDTVGSIARGDNNFQTNGSHNAQDPFKSSQQTAIHPVNNGLEQSHNPYKQNSFH